MRDDNVVNPGIHYDESNGTALNIRDITGGALSSVIKCLKSSQPVAGFDEELAKFHELAGVGSSSNQREQQHEAPVDESPSGPGGGRLPTVHEETEADLDAHSMEGQHEEFNEEKVL